MHNEVPVIIGNFICLSADPCGKLPKRDFIRSAMIDHPMAGNLHPAPGSYRSPVFQA